MRKEGIAVKIKKREFICSYKWLVTFKNNDEMGIVKQIEELIGE